MTDDERKDRLYTEFSRTFMRAPELMCAAPGRTELLGNHTDHQRGCVVAGAVELTALCAAGRRDDGHVRIISHGFPEFSFELTAKKGEVSGSAALVCGVADWFLKQGYSVCGFDAIIESQVLAGSGLSSSAAFEVLIGCLLSELCNGGALEAKELAIAGRYAENEYFGKPCGLMDQLACAVGGVVAIDFAKPLYPAVKRIETDFESMGYALCIADTKSGHEELTAAYAAIPAEMGAVAGKLGHTHLAYCDEGEFYDKLPLLRRCCGDRAVLRASHFFEENNRAKLGAELLLQKDIQGYLALVRESGASSYKYLQNIYAGKDMSVAVALMCAERFLRGAGAVRVHGGGFAGTIQAFVPVDAAAEFARRMDGVFGEGSCIKLKIRAAGAAAL